jgi:hypothetical protein
MPALHLVSISHHAKGEFIRVAVTRFLFQALDLGLFGIVVFGAE